MSELIKPTRRGFITGLTSLLASPAIVRISSIMPVKALTRAKFVTGVDLGIEYGTVIYYSAYDELQSCMDASVNSWLAQHKAQGP